VDDAEGDVFFFARVFLGDGAEVIGKAGCSTTTAWTGAPLVEVFLLNERFLAAGKAGTTSTSRPGSVLMTTPSAEGGGGCFTFLDRAETAFVAVPLALFPVLGGRATAEDAAVPLMSGTTGGAEVLTFFFLCGTAQVQHANKHYNL
jgi:hypothetical protein